MHFGKLSPTKRPILSRFVLTAASIACSCPTLLRANHPGGRRLVVPLDGRASAPSFDVATIKPHPSDGDTPFVGIRNTQDGIEGAFVTIQTLIQRAYLLRSPDQVSGGPEWTRNERFDIQAKMSEAEMTQVQKAEPRRDKGSP